jgi:hypothetical protein
MMTTMMVMVVVNPTMSEQGDGLEDNRRQLHDY